MRLHRLTSFGFGALALVLAGGCGGGQTGDLSGKGEHRNDKVGHETSNGCDEQRAEVGFDEQTEAGSGEELLAYAERTFDAPLKWKEAREGQAWSAGPEAGTSAVRVRVTRGSKAYRITYTQPQNDSGQEIATAALLCPPPRLGVEATVEVSTEGGALAESFDTVLRSETPGVAMLNVPFALDALAGELSLQSSDPNATLVQLGLDAVLTSAGTTGSISGVEEVRAGATVGASPAVLAEWPGLDSCGGGEGLELALADEALGATGEATLAEVAPGAPVAVEWLDGESTTLRVGVEAAGPGCFSVSDSPIPGDGGPVAQYPVTITLQSADGRLDGTYEGQVAARYRDGRRVAAASATLLLGVDDVADSGFASASLPPDTEMVLLQFESTSGSGSVRLIAMSGSPCAKQSSGAGSGGSGVPGCAGATQTPVEAASWAD